jgi:hypothetical protein
MESKAKISTSAFDGLCQLLVEVRWPVSWLDRVGHVTEFLFLKLI